MHLTLEALPHRMVYATRGTRARPHLMTDPVSKTMTIGMLGLGHVGLTLAAVLADAGHTVRGYDLKKEVREKVASGNAHFSERGLDELLEKHVGKNLLVVEDFKGENSCDAYIVTVGTPLTRNLEPDYSYLDQAAADLGKVVKKGDLILLRSTVPLGVTRTVVLPRIEQISGLSRGDLHIAFAPERTIEGNAIAELRGLPQVVGGIDAASTKAAAALFHTITDKVVELPTLEEAEIVKLINNAYRETVFSFANEVSLVSRAWGIDTKRVIRAANEGYPRSTIPLPSPGIGGYCLTKDGHLLSKSAKEKRVPLRIIPETRYVSSFMIDSLADEITRHLDRERPGVRRPVVALLGLAFKGAPATSDIRGSMSLALMKRLSARRPFVFAGYDPHVPPERIAETGAVPAATREEALKDADIVVVMNNNPAFAGIASGEFASDRPVMLFDTWGLNDPSAFEDAPHIHYRTL